MEINAGDLRGNSSRLFDMDERINVVENQEDVVPLIPYGMQWDQHDSVKYAHINHKEEKLEESVKKGEEKREIEPKLEESTSKEIKEVMEVKEV